MDVGEIQRSQGQCCGGVNGNIPVSSDRIVTQVALRDFASTWHQALFMQTEPGSLRYEGSSSASKWQVAVVGSEQVSMLELSSSKLGISCVLAPASNTR